MLLSQFGHSNKMSPRVTTTSGAACSLSRVSIPNLAPLIMQGERTFCKPLVLLVLVQFDFEDTAIWILEEKVGVTPKCRFGEYEVR